MAKKKEEVKELTPEEQHQKNKEDYIAILTKFNRDGMEDLLKYMEDIGFFDAPCSGGNHLCEEHGLLKHSLNVMLMVSILSHDLAPELEESAVLAAALHDLGKCGDYGKQMYVPNILKSGKPSTAKPYKRNPELLPIDHATRSIKLAALFIDLTEDEEFAIRYHDGLYEPANYGVKGNETPLQLILHWADLWCARVIEHSNKEESEE